MSVEKILLAVKDVGEIFRYITGSSEDLFVMDSNGIVRTLDGEVVNEELTKDEFDYFFSKPMEEVMKNPKRAMNFHAQNESGLVYSLIYIPDERVSPENFYSNGYLGLEAALEAFEETFHALDLTPNNNLRDLSAREALAVLGRYLGMRYLKENGYEIENIIERALDGELIERRRENGLREFSFVRMPSVEYLPRVWLVGLIEHLEGLEFGEAIDEVRRIYQMTKNSNDPMEIIEQQGLKYGTLPSEYIMKMLY